MPISFLGNVLGICIILIFFYGLLKMPEFSSDRLNAILRIVYVVFFIVVSYVVVYYTYNRSYS